MAEIDDLDVIDANNTARFPEGMLGGQLNDSARALEGILARWFRDTNGSLASSGSSNAFAVTSSRTITELTDGIRLSFVANHAIDGAATLNLNGLGAKDVRRFNGSGLASGDIVAGQIVDVIYSASLDDWLMVSAPAALVGSTHADFGENATPGDPAADTARAYAKDDSGTTLLAYRDSAGTERELLGRATQAQMEAGTDTRQAVSPGRQHFHPGHPKAHGRVASDGTLQTGSYGIASVTKTGTGTYDVTLSVSTSNPTVKCGPLQAGRVAFGVSSSGTVIAVATSNTGNSAAQDSAFWIEVSGDQ